MAKPKYLVIDGCPVPYEVAPYAYLITRRAGQKISSAYRGEDPPAVKILHRNGKHTQAEIHRMLPNISNPPGQSQHDLHSDGFANRGPVGRRLAAWQVGFDTGGNDQASKERIEAAAHHYGLRVRHPYSRGVEGHHWCFARKPFADHVHLTRARVILIRARLRLNR